MKWLLSFLFPFSLCLAFPHFDPTSGLSLEMPDSFQLSETDQTSDQWWYKFTDPKGNEIIIEIEEFEKRKELEEHTKRAKINTYEENDQMRCEELDFEIFSINDLEICKCSLHLISLEEIQQNPLYLCDYLFVREHFGFTITLLKVEDEIDPERMMQKVLQSIQFSPCL